MRTISAVTTKSLRSRLLLLVILAGLVITLIPTQSAWANALGIPDSEYNALVALYNNTGGPSWSRNTGWLTSSSSWYGVMVNGGHVVQLSLANNLLTGAIPSELGSLTYLQVLILRSNQLMGPIPSSLMNLTQLQPGPSSISYNGLYTTDCTLAAFLTSKFPYWDTTQTIAPTNVSARGAGSVTVSWTPIAYAGDAGYYEVGVSSTPGGPYTFDCTRRTPSKMTSSMTITGLPMDKLQYFVVRTVTLPSSNVPVQLTSEFSAEAIGNYFGIPDSELKALVALYNSTGGASWLHNFNWMTNYGGWFGVTISGGHVTQLNLQSNLLNGTIPAELGDLTNLQSLNLRGNMLVGSLPSSLMNLAQLQPGSSSTISYNGLYTSDSALAAFLSSKFPGWDLTQTVAPTNVTARGTGAVTVSWTPIPYTSDGGGYEIGLSSTPGGPYIFDSTKRTSSKSASSLTISGLPIDKPQYVAVRTYTTPNGYNQSIVVSDPSRETLVNGLGIPDSEFNALVALYNSTGGPGWTRSEKWLTLTGGWYGVYISTGHVRQLALQGNLLTGAIPPELGDLAYLQGLNLRGNRLMGTIPSSLTNLTQLLSTISTISYNGLYTTDSALAAFLSSKFPGWDTTQTIAPTNVSASGTSTVAVSWSPILYTADSGYYEVGISSTPGGPFTFDSSRRTYNKNTLRLYVNGLPSDSPHFFAVRTVTLPNTCNQSTLTSDPSAEVTDCGNVKLKPNKSPVAIVGGVVTAVFPDCSYVEFPDRSCGVRVTTGATVMGPGKVDLCGTMSTDPVTGERYLQASSMLNMGPGTVAPLAISNANLGGGPWRYSGYNGPGQTGIAGAFGLNNIGLLVRVCGRITDRDSAVPAKWFKIDDGSGVGVKCVIPAGVGIDPTWTYVGVTGISSCEGNIGSLSRLLRVRTRDDIVEFQ